MSRVTACSPIESLNGKHGVYSKSPPYGPRNFGPLK